ncbi:MAG: type II toxin-antitoxin system RelE/ParE family toxin [Patescibacteria group bacterium]
MSVQSNEVVYDDAFVKDVRRLPAEVGKKIGALIEILREDPFDPRLHTKPLSAPLQGIFSFRIGRDYRVGFQLRAARIIHLLMVDKRGDIYRHPQRKA